MFCTDLKQDNGGIVSRDMDTADVRIADDIKKAGRAAPENSVSWKFIEQSVKKGVLEHVEDHRINAQVRNPAAAFKPSNRRRVPFTAEDDQILSNWLAKKEKEGSPISGNVIYQDLEELCPRHTAQSWRHRALSFRGLLPKPKTTAQDPAAPVSAPHATQNQTRAPSSSMPQLSSLGNRGRVFFTKEDDELLLKYVEEARYDKHGNDVRRGAKIYKVLAEEHPHHTHHSWRDRYVRHLEPQLLANEAANNPPTPPPPVSRPATIKKPVPRQPNLVQVEPGPTSTSIEEPARPATRSTGEKHETGVVPAPEKTDTENLSTAKNKRTTVSPHPEMRARTNPPVSLSREASNPQEEKARVLQLNIRKKQAAKTLQRRWRGYLVRRRLDLLRRDLPHLQALCRGSMFRSSLRDGFVPFQALSKGATVRMALRPDGDGVHNEEDDDPVAALEEQITKEMTLGASNNPTTPEQEFYANFSLYLQFTGAKINQWPKVQGRALQLWDLWNAVNPVRPLDQDLTMEASHFDRGSPRIRDWEGIAERLGFNWVNTPDVTHQLRQCYETNLGEYEKSLDDFEKEGLGSEAESESQDTVAHSDDAEIMATQPDLPSQSLPFQSSPPRIHGQKRSFESYPASSSVDLSFSPHKRVRYSKDVEIPSTPEKKTAGGSSWEDKLSERGRKAAVVTSIESDDPFVSTLGVLPQLQHPLPARPRVEPETQDFGFEDAGFQSQPDVGSFVGGISPSQQLHLENDLLSPIPFSGFDGPQPLYRSPLNPTLDSTTSLRKVVPDPTRAKPANPSIISSIETQVDDDPTPKAQTRHVPPPRSPSPALKAKRRSLPASFRRAVSPPTTKVPPAAQPRTSLPTHTNGPSKTFLPPSRLSHDGASSGPSGNKPRAPFRPLRDSPAATSRPSRPSHRSHRSHTTPTTPTPAAPIKTSKLPSPPPGSFRDTMDYYISLGYAQRHVIEAFRSTLTWSSGTAAHVMQHLKDGKGIPENWEGVWTKKDDEDLRFVQEVKREVEERRGRRGGTYGQVKGERDRVRRAERLGNRLEVKHGRDRMKWRAASYK